MARRLEARAAEVVERALSGSRAGLVDATMVYTFALDPFAAWCEAHAPRSERDPVGPFEELLFAQGRDHERRVVEARFPDAWPLRADTEEDAFRAAVEAMAAGARAIHGAPLYWLPEGLKGRADILERRDEGASVFGSYHYVVKEVKLAKNIRDHHRLQAAFYNHVLGKLQGHTPSHVHVIDRDHRESTLAYSEAEILTVLRAIREIRAGHKPPAVHGAGAPQWSSYTDRCAREARDVSLVAGVGRATRDALARGGFATVDALASADEARLLAVRGVGKKRAQRFATGARAIVEGRHIPLARVSLPRARTEVFLDLEGTGAQLEGEDLVEMDYLIGALVRRDGAERYRAFVARSRDGEAEMWREFVEWAATLDDPVLYHWTHYEPTHLRRLAERHGLAPGLHEPVFGRLRDLHKDATGAFAFPTPSTSIKAIAPYLGFSWRHKDVGAMASIALYFEYLEAPDAPGAEAKLEKVLDYNEDDCIAMRVVKDWLVAQAEAAQPAGSPHLDTA